VPQKGLAIKDISQINDRNSPYDDSYRLQPRGDISLGDLRCVRLQQVWLGSLGLTNMRLIHNSSLKDTGSP